MKKKLQPEKKSNCLHCIRKNKRKKTYRLCTLHQDDGYYGSIVAVNICRETKVHYIVLLHKP